STMLQCGKPPRPPSSLTKSFHNCSSDSASRCQSWGRNMRSLYSLPGGVSRVVMLCIVVSLFAAGADRLRSAADDKAAPEKERQEIDQPGELSDGSAERFESPVDQSFWKAMTAIAKQISDPRGGERFVSVNTIGEEIPFDLNTWERDRLLSQYADF